MSQSKFLIQTRSRNDLGRQVKPSIEECKIKPIEDTKTYIKQQCRFCDSINHTIDSHQGPVQLKCVGCQSISCWSYQPDKQWGTICNLCFATDCVTTFNDGKNLDFNKCSECESIFFGEVRFYTSKKTKQIKKRIDNLAVEFLSLKPKQEIVSHPKNQVKQYQDVIPSGRIALGSDSDSDPNLIDPNQIFPRYYVPLGCEPEVFSEISEKSSGDDIEEESSSDSYEN